MTSNSEPFERSIHTGVPPDETAGPESSAEATTIPWIDGHQHTQTISWNEQNKLALGGCHAAVMIAYNPHWTPYRPVAPSDVRYQWDLAIKWTDFLDANHLFDTYVAVGIHTNAKVESPATLLEALPKYCDHDRVVAIGETGVEPVQYDSRWPIDDQRPVIGRQMEIAQENELPVILHTPTTKTGVAAGDTGWGGLRMSQPDPQIDYERAKIEATKMDIEIKDDAGLDDRRVIVDHGNPENIEYVMESTDCYLGFSVSSPLKGVTAEDIAETVRTYGPDRLLVNSDMMGYRRCDYFCIPRTIQKLHKAGIDLEALETIFYRNPAEIYQIN